MDAVVLDDDSAQVRSFAAALSLPPRKPSLEGRSIAADRRQRGEHMAGTSENGIGAEPAAHSVICRATALELKDEFSEIPRTRKAVGEALRGWGFETLIDDFVILASELATNALRHGEPPVTVLLRLCKGVLHLEVSDASAAEPEIRESNPERCSGQGLLLVRALSDEWGWWRNDTGKTVWCQLSPKQYPLEAAAWRSAAPLRPVPSVAQAVLDVGLRRGAADPPRRASDVASGTGAAPPLSASPPRKSPARHIAASIAPSRRSRCEASSPLGQTFVRTCC
ncbi:hypothetical protein GCM10010245_79270 [Streptomyces spectabilis]|nr:hypothetical protein GCM10010245_79270 [Streptomyces spectabilis]